MIGELFWGAEPIVNCFGYPVTTLTIVCYCPVNS